MYAYSVKSEQFSFYFELKGVLVYFCFNNKLLVRSTKYLTPYSGSEITPNDTIFPVGKINFIMLFLAIVVQIKQTVLFFSRI